MSDPKRLDARPVSAPPRAEKPRRARMADGLPTMAEARRRLTAWQSKPSPCLAPEVPEAVRDLPELIGSPSYRKPRRTG